MREHRYTLEMPHSPERLWALFQDYDNWTAYAPMVIEVQVVHPGDANGNGLLRRVIYQMPLGRKGELVVEELPTPEVGEGDVLIEVSHCGVCGSDLHMILDGWGRKGSVEGHEWSGTVVAVGDGVTEWSVGDHIVGGPSPRCGE